MGKKRLEKYANGICLQLDQNAAPITNLNGGLRRTLFNQAADGGGPVAGAITGSIGALNNEYASLHRELQTYWAERQENGNVVKCFVPFHMIFPAIDDLPDDGCAFTGYGQTIKMNLRTNIPADFVCQVGGGAAPAFALSNMVLVKCFSKLDQPRADLVLKSNITFPLCKYVHWQQQITTNVVNALFSVQRSELIRGLWFAFHTRIQGDATAEATNILANLGNNAAAQFKNPLSYFIQAPIQQIDLLIGGEPVVINLQQIQLLHITDDAFADGKPTYHDPRLRGIKHAYFLDLRRFSKDLFGSSAKQTTTVQVQITLKTGAGSRTIKGQPGDWAIAPAEAANAMGLDRFAFFSYLETMSFMDLKGGQYTSA